MEEPSRIRARLLLLKTKTYLPPFRQGRVRRPRLYNRLDARVWRAGAFWHPGKPPGQELALISAVMSEENLAEEGV